MPNDTVAPEARAGALRVDIDDNGLFDPGQQLGVEVHWRDPGGSVRSV